KHRAVHPVKTGLSPSGGGTHTSNGGQGSLTLAVAIGLAPAGPTTGSARESPWARVGALAVVAFDRSDPVPGGGSLGEVRVVQPMLFFHAGALDRLRLTGVLNFEGATIPQGELAAGNWGEGFVDRRHPH